ncbi:MAG TPA: cache domain-containing protein [Stellaceae bacterium]|nr:cache domain-containing protein [Stellaceae bacterium]
MLGNLRISTKFLITIGVFIVGVIAVAAMGLMELRQNLVEDRKIKVHDIVTIAQQVVAAEGKLAESGAVSQPDAMARAKAALGSLRFGNDDYIFVIDSKGVNLVHPNPKVVGQNMLDNRDSDGKYFSRELMAAAAAGGGYVSYRYPRGAGGDPLPKISYALEYKPWGWMIGSGIYIDDIDAIFWSQVVHIGLLIGVTLAAIVAFCFLLGRSITKPLGVITGSMQRLAEGDKTITVAYVERGDEVGALAKSLSVFRENAQRIESMEEDRRAAEAKATQDRRAATMKLADDFEHRVKAVVDAVSTASQDMRGMAGQLQKTAEETSRRSTLVAGASEEASTNVQTVASAAEELSASISEISRQVAHAASIAQRAVGETRETDEMIQGLATAAAKIGEVVSLISDVASQTNLLALNATIEAARAGEAGKGFAVVASEVKALANQTGKATEEIAGQVAAIQSATNSAVAAIKRIGSTIGEVNEVSSSIASAVEEQGAATKEITRNTQEASRGTQEVSANIAGVSQGASETGSSASKVLTGADELGGQATRLKGEVDRFLAEVRAS